MGGKVAKPKAKKQSPHVKKLVQLETELATTTDPELAALPVVDDEMEARQQFYNVVWRIKNALDWERLPRGSAA